MSDFLSGVSWAKCLCKFVEYQTAFFIFPFNAQTKMENQNSPLMSALADGSIFNNQIFASDVEANICEVANDLKIINKIVTDFYNRDLAKYGAKDAPEMKNAFDLSEKLTEFIGEFVNYTSSLLLDRILE